MMVKTTHLSDFGIDETYLAHTPKETLIEHSNLTLEYFHKISKSKNIETILDNLLKKIDSENLELLKEIFVNTIYLHDIGKTNPYFQAKKMNNKFFAEFKNDTASSDHSFYSSQKFVEYYLEKINTISDKITKEKFKFLLYAFSYHQAKHHGNLASFEEYRKDEKDPNFYWQYLDRFKIPYFEFYILNKLLFSLLVSSDYYATSDYMTGVKTDDFGLFSDIDKIKLKEKFDTYLLAPKFQNPQGINKLRNEMFYEAETNLLKHKKKNIFYLEAPTGSGKTITSINLALNLLKENDSLGKLFYIFPFNTLVEQTKNVFDEIFGDSLKIETINSIAPIGINEEKQEDEETKYTKSYINRLFFHSPAIITTHVSLFNILFGTSKEDNFPLWQLANSVIILDEIQSYNNHLWWYMVEFFEKYATLLNMKIIIMSATLPKLDFFLEEGKKDSFVELISNKKYFFQNELFKNRVKIDFSLVKETMTIENLVEILQSQPKDKKILFEFIKKQSARAFYNAIKDKFDNVCELSGDDNKAYRQYVINKSKKENLIIVATQVIEAGVDIDMDIGFKDISTIDSEEQFMGRINRSCLRDGIVYFFNMDKVEDIYRGDNRLGLDLTQTKYREILQNKEFNSYYKEVLESIKKQGDRFQNGLMTNYDNFAELVKKLNYKEISKTMTLINSQNFTLYFPFQINLSIYEGVQEFVGLDECFKTDGKLDGQKVWDEFKALNEIESFSKKEVQKSKINSLMQFFTFNIFKYYDGQRPHIGEEMYGYYFVENLEYITDDGKFDREKFNKDKNSRFL
ncbi:MAG: CRISPR-associated helicase Cas3' [Arcobacteraceae bacterium]